MPITASSFLRTAEQGRIVVGVGDLAITDDPSASIITHGLGSCIGVTIWDPEAMIGGMLHFMLPTSRGNPKRAEENPAMFGDLGIPLLFKACYDLGARKDRMIVCAAGGAEILDDDGHFKVGTRNRTILRKLFWKNSVLLSAEATGGSNSRTITLKMESGAFEIRTKGKVTQLWPE